MEFGHLEEQIVHLNSTFEKKRVVEFLKNQNLSFDEDIEYSMALFDQDKIVGTGSFSSRTLKCIAVSPEYKNMGLANMIVTHLIQEEFRRGNIHLFLYTKPENEVLFSEMGFYKISKVDSKVLLMENRRDGIKNYLEEISQYRKDGKVISSIVMNCNPFTLGHQYLIEYAAVRSDQLHVFIVWEDKSAFPSEVRHQLVVEGIKHLSNVVVHKGKDYIISAATFPSYFIKAYQKVVKIHALLDLKVFGEHIAPTLGINKRFVGEEPYCPVTRTYNSIMKQELPESGIEVVEVPRLLVGKHVVSASKVREYIKEEKFSEIKKLVPVTTYRFLVSKKAGNIIHAIQTYQKRH